MSDAANKYSIMISGSVEPLAEALRTSGIGRYISGISAVPSGANLERALILHPASILVITEDAALRYAPAAYKKGCLAVLLVNDRVPHLHTYIDSGVFCCTRAELPATLPQLLAACTRLRETRGEAEALRGKLDEARLISRAKLLLISRFKMSEDEAHRFLERSAMDNCTKLRNAAESVIRTYEE